MERMNIWRISFSIIGDNDYPYPNESYNIYRTQTEEPISYEETLKAYPFFYQDFLIKNNIKESDKIFIVPRFEKCLIKTHTKEKKEDSKKKLNCLPELKDGMFGIKKTDNEFEPFVIANNKLVYENGGWDEIKESYCDGGYIDAIYSGQVNSFYSVLNDYEVGCCRYLLWRREE